MSMTRARRRERVHRWRKENLLHLKRTMGELPWPLQCIWYGHVLLRFRSSPLSESLGVGDSRTSIDIGARPARFRRDLAASITLLTMDL